jgi:hypothetical protein
MPLTFGLSATICGWRRIDIRERELEIARLEARLRAPKGEAPNLERLREALEQRAAEWRQTLREEPKVARVLLRRLIGPLELYDESTRPDFIKADTELQTALIDGLAEIQDIASPPGFDHFLTRDYLLEVAAV